MQSVSVALTNEIEKLLKAYAVAPGFSIGIAADRIARGHLPVLKKELIADPKIVVVPASIAGDEADRGSEATIFGVFVGISKAINAGDQVAEVDDLVGLVEEVQSVLASDANKALTLTVKGEEGEAIFEPPFSNLPLFSQERLRESGIFLSVTTFNFRVDLDRS